MSEKQIDFAKQSERLDQIVQEISSQALPLEKSLELYEEGMKIIKELETALQEAEAKVEKVITIEDK